MKLTSAIDALVAAKPIAEHCGVWMLATKDELELNKLDIEEWVAVPLICVCPPSSTSHAQCVGRKCYRFGGATMLTKEQREELVSMGTANVREHISHYGGGRNAAIGGFKTGDMTRDDIYEWLKEAEGRASPKLHLLQKFAAYAAMGSFLLTLFVILPITAVTYWRQPDPETKRREALIAELFRDYSVTAPHGFPSIASEFRIAAQDYVNAELKKRGERFRYDGKADKILELPRRR